MVSWSHFPPFKVAPIVSADAFFAVPAFDVRHLQLDKPAAVVDVCERFSFCYVITFTVFLKRLDLVFIICELMLSLLLIFFKI